MSVAALPDLNVLPADALRALILTQHQQLLSRESEIAHLKLLIAKLQRMQFGRKSEKLQRQIQQLELRLEELQANREETSPAESPTATPPMLITSPAVKRTRRALPEHLPRETQTHAPKQAKCDCGGELRKLGEDVSEVLEYVPDHFKVIRHVRTKLSCTKCDCIVQAAAPSRPIERGVAGPGLLAHVLVSKYADHLPLYRQSEIYARHGVDLERSTLADWVGGTAQLLEPLVEALRRYAIAAGKLHADDTPVPVLAPGNGKTKTGRLWTYVRDDRRQQIRPRPRCGLRIRRIAKVSIPSGTCESSAVRCKPTPTPDLISFTKTAASRKRRAGPMCGANFTIYNKRTLHQWRVKRSSESGCSMRSRKRFATGRRKNGVRSARRGPSRCSILCGSGSRRRCRSFRANRTRRSRFATRSRSGRRCCVIRTTDTSRSITTPPNVRCARLRWAAKTICLRDRIQAVSVRRPSTA